MNIKYLLPLAFVFLFLSACQKEADEVRISTSQEFSPENYLANLTETVLFQMDHENLETGDHAGWFINPQGEIVDYAYNSERLTSGHTCNSLDLTELTEAAGKVWFSVPAEELAAHFRKGRNISSLTLNEVTENADEKIVTRIMAFRAMAGNNGGSTSTTGSGGECHNGGPGNTGPAYAEQEFQIIQLKSVGTISQLNTHSDAQAIIDWLEGLDAKLNL